MLSVKIKHEKQQRKQQQKQLNNFKNISKLLKVHFTDEKRLF